MSLNSFRNGLGNVTASPVGKWSIFVLGALLVFSLVFSGLGNNLGGGPRGGGGAAGGPASETVATVNGDAITRGDYEQQMESLRRQYEQMGQTMGVMAGGPLHARALENVVQAKLALQQAKKQGLTVSDADIDRERMLIVQKDNVAQSLGLKPNASLREIDAARAKNGLSSLEDALPDEAVRQDVLLTKLQTFQDNKIVVTEADARQSFHQWHTRHVLIDNKKRSDVQAQSQAQQVLAKAKATGADFAALAKQYSDDPGTKDKGGDDGFIDQNTGYVPEFLTAAQALKPGEVSLIKSPQFGYFVIKLDAVRDNLPKDFDKNPAQYVAQIRQQKQGQAQQAFITGLQNDPHNKIVVTDPQLRADRTLLLAGRAGDPVMQQAAFQSALADYAKALKLSPSPSVAGEIHAEMGQVYQATGQTPQAIAALEAATKSTEDADLRMALGTLYQKAGQTDKAVAQFQMASQQAYDNPELHKQLVSTYTALGKPALAKGEQDWQTQYQQRQQSQALPPGMSGLPPGATVTAAPAPPPAATVTTAPAASSHAPGTGVTVVPNAAPAKKP